MVAKVTPQAQRPLEFKGPNPTPQAQKTRIKQNKEWLELNARDIVCISSAITAAGLGVWGAVTAFHSSLLLTAAAAYFALCMVGYAYTRSTVHTRFNPPTFTETLKEIAYTPVRAAKQVANAVTDTFKKIF